MDGRSFQITHQTAAGERIRLQCWQWAPGGLPVVTVHGMNAHGLHWRHLAERLAPRYSLISYDLRGHGDSDKPQTGYSFEEHAEDLRALIERVTTDPPAVIGHSLGARVAMAYAVRHPLRGLVIIDPGIVAHDQPRPPADGSHRQPTPLAFEYDSEAAFMERMRRTNFLRNWSPYAEEYARNLIEPEEGGRVRLKFRPHVLQETSRAIRGFDALACLDAIACPTLVIRATEGHLRDEVARRMVAGLRDGRLAVIEGSNHNVPLDKAEVFEPLIERFLQEVYP